jgi:hypothetical protein
MFFICDSIFDEEYMDVPKTDQEKRPEHLGIPATGWKTDRFLVLREAARNLKVIKIDKIIDK